MTNEEAIRVLKATSVNLGRTNGKTVYAEAMNRAITALEAQECGDAISRNLALSEVKSGMIRTIDGENWKRVSENVRGIKELPSVAPVIRAQMSFAKCEDAISRQAAIRIVDDIDTFTAGWRDDAMEQMKQLPSVTPEPIKITTDHAPTPDELERLKQAMRNTPVMLLPSNNNIPNATRCKNCKHWLHEHLCIELSKYGTIETVSECEEPTVQERKDYVKIPETGIGDLSDGYHTFNGLYEQRMILFAALVKAYKDKAWKSYRHEDGEYCFGGGWFIVGIDTPEGSYTYHYENKYWNMFDCKDLPRAKHWDGHTEADAETRLMSLEPVQERRWIPVTERLPEEGQGCLVCDKGSILIDTFTGRGNPYNWKWYVRDYEAWMPLPEPYREEGEQE